ncbi:hypothetical protein BRADI_1g43995v3 [Brachypodium distachyon]|uniref:DUF4283 domain-containing protein n=1 Tax=Brachypodium distachyon TaxID=15368 RepID=A0A0Q3S0X1_BRADI|nr:hypothetical protein BRADI_1g43995v3 [Brachypodium distachyon]
MHRWRLPITVPPSRRPNFFMVASFGRCKFCRIEESVEEFRVCHLRDRTFRFYVTNKNIGFHIAGLNSFTCTNFVVYFHLWGFGGPDFIKEFAAWEKEELLKWESPKKAQSPPRASRSFVQVAAQARTTSLALMISDTRSSLMANFVVDPVPFVLGLFDIIDAEGRPQHSRYHIRGRIEPQNEDVAIVTLQPPPNPDALFEETRDWLVRNGPHQHNGITFTFTEHNRAQNWRGFTYNQEVWLMILGFHLDIWTSEHIANAIADWGKLILWDRTVNNYSRIIIKVKVVDLSLVPYSLLLSHGSDFQGETWVAPVYILHQAFMSALPTDEDARPGDGDTPHPLPVLPFEEDHGNNANHGPIIPDLNMEADFWGPWDQALHNAGANAHDLFFLPEGNQAANVQHIHLEDVLLQMPQDQDMHALHFIAAPDAQPADQMQLPTAASENIHHDLQNVHAGHNNMLNDGQENMQIGRVIIPPFNHPQENFPALYGPHLTKPNLELLHTSTDSNEIWIKHFCPRSNRNSISVPQPWVDFFTASLISPESFEWASKVLLSNMWTIFSENAPLSKDFYIPDTCPSSSPLKCDLTARAAMISKGYLTPHAPTKLPCLPDIASTSAIRGKREKKAPLVVTEVRRSERINKKNGGYKHNTCVDRHCLACSAKPPEISKKIIRNLNERFGLAKNDIES